MSERYRYKRLAYFITGRNPYLHRLTWWDIARFIASVFVSLMMLYLVVNAFVSGWYGLSSLRLENIHQYRHEKQEADNQRDRAASQIANKCTGPLKSAQIIAECLTHAISSYEQQKDVNADAEAQQDMAFWAKYTFWITVVGLFLSFVGLIALFISLRQTRQTISNDREVGHAQVRAYLSIEPQISGDIEVGKIAKCTIKITNTGQSPAYDVIYLAGSFVDEHPWQERDIDIFTPVPGQIKPGTSVAAGSYIEAEANTPSELTPDEVRSIMNEGDRRLYMACIVFYNDVFKKVRHKTRFCGFLEPVGDPIRHPNGRTVRNYSWMLTHKHNDAC
jgi:hypothetical protein